jgi:osmotically-inducible protein OsmY
MLKKIIVVGTLLMTSCAPLVPAVVATGAGVGIAQERSAGQNIDDKVIFTKIKHKFIQGEFNELFSKITVDVNSGRVLLTGSVEKHENMMEAVRQVWQVKGVKEVINEIEIGARTPAQRTKDLTTLQHLRVKLLMAKDVRSVNYTLSVINGHAYILGIARTQDELDKVLRILSETKSIKKVISHVSMKEDHGREGDF